MVHDHAGAATLVPSAEEALPKQPTTAASHHAGADGPFTMMTPLGAAIRSRTGRAGAVQPATWITPPDADWLRSCSAAHRQSHTARVRPACGRVAGREGRTPRGSVKRRSLLLPVVRKWVNTAARRKGRAQSGTEWVMRPWRAFLQSWSISVLASRATSVTRAVSSWVMEVAVKQAVASTCRRHEPGRPRRRRGFGGAAYRGAPCGRVCGLRVDSGMAHHIS